MYYEIPFLEKGSKKYICPSCGKNTLKRYVQYGKHIHETVGRCNREDKCGYHKPPREYYAVNNIKMPKLPTIQKQTLKPQGEKPIDYIPKQYIWDYAKNRNNNLIYYLFNLFSWDIIKERTDPYFLGSYKDRAVIFWQIDENGNCRTGKIQEYNKETGKRIKDENKKPVSLIHSYLSHWGELPHDFNMQMCLFGLHLIRSKNNIGKTICICESEKSAVIAACCMPQYIWMAAGALHWLNVEKLKPLKGWNVVLFPDTSTNGDAFKLWSKIANEANKVGLNVIVSDLLETICTDEQKADGYDIADYLIDRILEPKQAADNKTIEPQSEPQSTEPDTDNMSDTLKEMIKLNPSLKKLIDDFDTVEM